MFTCIVVFVHLLEDVCDQLKVEAICKHWVVAADLVLRFLNFWIHILICVSLPSAETESTADAISEAAVSSDPAYHPSCYLFRIKHWSS